MCRFSFHKIEDRMRFGIRIVLLVQLCMDGRTMCQHQADMFASITNGAECFVVCFQRIVNGIDTGLVDQVV